MIFSYRISSTESKKIVREKLKNKQVITMMTVRHPLERIISMFNEKFGGGTYYDPRSVGAHYTSAYTW